MPQAIAAVVMFAFTLWCVLDVVLTDQVLVRNLPKLTWLLLVLFVPAIGGIAWIVAGRPERASYGPGSTRSRSRPAGRGGSGRGRPPAGGRSRPPAPRGPDDDPAFLRALEERLRREADGDASDGAAG